MSGPHHLEQGYADVLEHAAHPQVPAPPSHPPIPGWIKTWERHRPQWLMELIAEAIGVGIYCYIGAGCLASFVLSSVAKETGFGDILTIGLGYGFAIALAILIAAPTSGGHLSPSYTIAFALFKGFPWRKVPQYILAQTFGAFVASLLVYAQYRQQIHAYTLELKALGPAGDAILFSPQGPAGIIAAFPSTGQQLGLVFLNEFLVNVILSLVVHTVLDPSNFFISMAAAPWVIGIAYAGMIWGFAADTIVLNTARDLGGRFAAACIWGTGAFPMKYSAIAALTNIPATAVGALIHIFFLSDTMRPMVNPPPEGSAPMMELRRKATAASAMAPAPASVSDSGEKK